MIAGTLKERWMFFLRWMALVGLVAGLVGCAPAGPIENTPTLAQPLVLDTATPVPSLSPSPALTDTLPPASAPTGTDLPAIGFTDTSAPTLAPTLPTPTITPTFDPLTWTTLPVLPELSPRALAVLREGLERGRNPRAFSKVGDCESQAYWFLGDFDSDPANTSLGPYQTKLAPVIEYYQGSFDRVSLAARPGFSAASLMAPIWADRQLCEKNETPIACEYRTHQPLVAFVMLGSNDASNPKTFEGHMRRVIEYSLSEGVLPILGTKADNVEGDHFINATVARLAYEYELPLWNYWLAVQDLPDQGLQEDGVHLTFAPARFDDPEAMKRAWPVRNLNALQVLRRTMDGTEVQAGE